MNNNYKVPNLNEGLDLMNNSGDVQDNCMLRILQNMNKPKAINESVEAEDKKVTATCPECGATWTPEVTMEDGSKQVCPMCDHVCNPEAVEGTGDAHVEAEPTVTESASQEPDEDQDEKELEESLKKYMECIDNGDAAGAKAILESVEATAICESVDGVTEIMLEKFVIKVNAEGKKQKVKVRTKKMKRTPAQKAALRKARKTANKGGAKKKRKKAMKARARMGLTESLRKSRTINAVQKLAESAGITLDAKAIERAINEAYDLNESEVILKDENVLSTLENILRNKGIEIVESETEVIDGVIVAHLEVTDTDAEVYLGDVADEVEEALQGYDVDYDEPEEDDEEDNVVFIDFYFIPVLTTESANAPVVEEEPTVPATETHDDVVPEGTTKVNESLESMVESFAGGMSNIRCKINPAFIKQGQVIYDADDNTVFTALTESVACDGGYSLAVDIHNSANQELADLVSGAEVNLGATGRYFLLKQSPVK